MPLDSKPENMRSKLGLDAVAVAAHFWKYLYLNPRL